MRKRTGFVGAVAALLFATDLGAAGNGAVDFDGFWMDSDGEVILEIGPCGSSRCGKVVWLKQPLGGDGQPLRDVKNPDLRLRSRPVCGLEVVTNFAKQSDGTWRGTVYVSDEGQSFSGMAEVLSATKIKVTGFIILPILGQSEIWTKVSAPPERCSGKARTR